MELTLEKNPEGAVAYTATLDTTSETVHPNRVFSIPIYKDAISSGYFADICGFRAKANSADALKAKILQLTDGLINMSRLPRHVFVARRAKKVYPIYTIDDEVISTTPGGPIFRHVELAKVREYLTDYLHEIDVLGANGISDKLHVRGTSLQTLQLRRPVFYLKKRNVGEKEFWAPVFETENLDGLYTYAASGRREIKNEFGGKNVLVLTRIVAEALITDKRLNDPFDLRPDRLQPAFWETLRPNLNPAGSTEIKGKTIDLYTSDGLHIGVEYREQEDRFGLFLDESVPSLTNRISADFTRRGF